MNSSAVDNPVATPQSDRLLFGSFFGVFRKLLSAVRKGPLGRVASRRERRLRLCETVPLGERRLLALIQFDNQPLLVGVTPNSITLLSQPAPCAPTAPPLSDFRETLHGSGEPQ